MDVTLETLLASRYVKFGRELPELDCWGMVRLGFRSLFGGPLLPSYDQTPPGDKVALTAAAIRVRDQYRFDECALRAGAVVTAWRADLCVHVGLVVDVDGRSWILETDEASGPCLTRPSVFEARYAKVIYYAN